VDQVEPIGKGLHPHARTKGGRHLRERWSPVGDDETVAGVGDGDAVARDGDADGARDLLWRTGSGPGPLVVGGLGDDGNGCDRLTIALQLGSGCSGGWRQKRNHGGRRQHQGGQHGQGAGGLPLR
ncbi:MAG: hypothetical protein ACK56F_02585, partial [bacterium]